MMSMLKDVNGNWCFDGDPSICSMIQGAFDGNSLDLKLNRTTLAHIPKIANLETFVDLRPISFFQVLYKMLTKVIVRRFENVMPSLIGPTQTSFLKERSISENICNTPI
ncbi:hypothetical protein V6N12_044876 [Hibiscus sabdariffa]|uniref:Reverse transcriptase domain-containing protein n=1 Tax=Hibiscus sabdariffa TaxID=183260 RepID=A0ABR2A669_9ROSI